MKKSILSVTLLSITFGFTTAQGPAERAKPIKQIQVTAQTIARQPSSKAYVLDLTRKGATYNLAAGIDYRRVLVRTGKGEITLDELLKKTGKSVSGKLRIGVTSDMRAQKLNLARVSGRTLNYSCEGILCSCSGDDDCNDMFTNAACGDIAVCDERGCWCFRI